MGIWCKDCGVPVIDKAAHDRLHALLDVITKHEHTVAGTVIDRARPGLDPASLDPIEVARRTVEDLTRD